MAIDADGHPFAYHPDNSGLDDLKHAGYQGNWWGIATHDASASGEPIIQKADDPAPGYFVSTTSLINPDYNFDNPLRYVDAAAFPYFVLPEKFKPAISLGDIAWIYNKQNKLSAFAVFADAGPDVGEGSMFLASTLGINNDPRYGGIDRGILYYIFDGSGKVKGWPIDQSEINKRGENLMKDIDQSKLIALL